MKVILISYASIKFDDDCYPRQSYDSSHVTRIADALSAGREMPPIVIAEGSNTCVDGTHRSRGYKRVYGPTKIVIPAIFKRYSSRRSMVLDAARLNSTHGKALNTCDKVHFFTIAKRNGINTKDAADALQLRVSDLERLIKDRLAFRPGKRKNGSPDVPLKSTVKNMAGKTLTNEQVEANKKLGGMRQAFSVNQVILLIKSKMIDLKDDGLVERLVVLRDALIGLDL